MNSPFSQKVVLKSTTKVSLNERFTNMLRNKQPVPVNIRATMQQQHLASARNRRLAQQMEHRPSVQAALQDKQSLKQRLGKSNIHARLGQPMGALRGGATGWGFTMGRLRGTTRGSIRGGRGGTMRGAISLQGMQMRRRGGHTLLVMQRGGLVGNGGGALIGRGVRGGFRGKILWGCDGFGGRGRGRGLGKGAGRPTVTREQLDNQLDAYMSKTKGHLDAELEAYMAQTDLEGME